MGAFGKTGTAGIFGASPATAGGLIGTAGAAGAEMGTFGKTGTAGIFRASPATTGGLIGTTGAAGTEDEIGGGGGITAPATGLEGKLIIADSAAIAGGRGIGRRLGRTIRTVSFLGSDIGTWSERQLRANYFRGLGVCQFSGVHLPIRRIDSNGSSAEERSAPLE